MSEAALYSIQVTQKMIIINDMNNYLKMADIEILDGRINKR